MALSMVAGLPLALGGSYPSEGLLQDGAAVMATLKNLADKVLATPTVENCWRLLEARASGTDQPLPEKSDYERWHLQTRERQAEVIAVLCDAADVASAMVLALTVVTDADADFTSLRRELQWRSEDRQRSKTVFFPDPAKYRANS